MVMKQSIGEFLEAIKTRRHDVVVKLADAVVNYQGKYSPILTYRGLYYDDGDGCSSPYVSFSEFGLEPLDNKFKLKCLAKAIIEQLILTGHEEYEIREYHPFTITDELYIIFDKKTPPKPEEKLSQW